MSPADKQMSEIERKLASAKPAKFIDKSTKQVATDIARELRGDTTKFKEKK